MSACVLATALCAAGGTASAGPNDDIIAEKRRQMAERDLEETGDIGRSLDVWKKLDGQLRLDPSKLDSNNQDGDRCQRVLASYAGKPDTVTFTLKKDMPGIKAGTHPWTAARPVCDAIIAAVDHQRKIGQFVSWAKGAKRAADAGKQKDDNTLTWCVSTYDDAIKAGAAPTDLIANLNMTMQAARDFCIERKGKLDALEAERVAPYKKLLKSDKLSMAINYTDYLFMPGGVELTPQRAAQFNVWFKDVVPERRCTDGRELHVLHRYQFNARQEMTKVTDREFCGAPPASAFR